MCSDWSFWIGLRLMLFRFVSFRGLAIFHTFWLVTIRWVPFVGDFGVKSGVFARCVFLSFFLECILSVPQCFCVDGG